MTAMNRWIIVGGGASGMATAFFLRQLGIDSVVIERENAVGGRMGTFRLGDRVLDCGGKNIGRRYRWFRRFAASLGSHPLEPFGLNSSQVIDGRIRTFDGAARWRTMAGLARGASARDLARFGRLLCAVASNDSAGFLGSRHARALGRRHHALPASRYFSPAFCDRIVRPMTVRMNGAEPDEAYVANLVSNVRMLLDSYEQFTHGLGPLLAAFLDRYDVRLQTTTEALIVSGGRVAGVRVRDAGGEVRELRGSGVILATPANAAAALTAPVAPELARQLRSVAYHPVGLIVAEYERPVFSPAVRALVFGPDEPLSNAGAYGLNDRHLVRYTFSGREFRRCLAERPDPGALLGRAEAALSRHVRLEPSGRTRYAAKRFDTGLCAYTPDQGRFLDALNRELQHTPGLFLTGDYVQGASIEACFRSAAACVHHLATSDRAAAPGTTRRLAGASRQHRCGPAASQL